MLILTRRIGESLSIGDDVTVTVMGLNGQQVRIGVSAPPSVRIFRSELLDGTRAPRVDGTADAPEQE